MIALLGNTYPPAMVRRQVLVTPISVEEAREFLADGFMSYWGHVNTVNVANNLLGVDVTPETERPAISLNEEGFPTLNGKVADKVVVLSPNYAPGYRPQEGEITPPEKIIGWQALLWDFAKITPASLSRERR